MFQSCISKDLTFNEQLHVPLGWQSLSGLSLSQLVGEGLDRPPVVSLQIDVDAFVTALESVVSVIRK